MNIFKSIFSRNIGHGKKLNENYDLKYDFIISILLRENTLVSIVACILSDYGNFIADLGDKGIELGEKREVCNMLHSESELPYPKKIIEDAFLFAFASMETLKINDFLGIPKETIEITAYELDCSFSPYEDTPVDHIKNHIAWLNSERVQKQQNIWRYLDKYSRLKRIFEFSYTEKCKGAWTPSWDIPKPQTPSQPMHL